MPNLSIVGNTEEHNAALACIRAPSRKLSAGVVEMRRCPCTFLPAYFYVFGVLAITRARWGCGPNPQDVARLWGGKERVSQGLGEITLLLGRLLGLAHLG